MGNECHSAVEQANATKKLSELLVIPLIMLVCQLDKRHKLLSALQMISLYVQVRNLSWALVQYNSYKLI